MAFSNCAGVTLIRFGVGSDAVAVVRGVAVERWGEIATGGDVVAVAAGC